MFQPTPLLPSDCARNSEYGPLLVLVRHFLTRRIDQKLLRYLLVRSLCRASVVPGTIRPGTSDCSYFPFLLSIPQSLFTNPFRRPISNALVHALKSGTRCLSKAYSLCLKDRSPAIRPTLRSRHAWHGDRRQIAPVCFGCIMHKFLAILWPCIERDRYNKQVVQLWTMIRCVMNGHHALHTTTDWKSTPGNYGTRACCFSSGDATIMLLSSVFSPLFLVRSVYIPRRAWVQWMANLWSISTRHTEPFVYPTHMLFKPCYLTLVTKTRT